eukprot:6213458-Pleurochrysis_carterae.AAC.1
MAEPASERASALFSPPAIPLSRGADRGVEAGGSGERGSQAPRLRAGGCIGSTHPTVQEAL